MLLLLFGKQRCLLMQDIGYDFTSNNSAMPVAVTIAVPNDARLHKGAVACHRYGAHVVVAQMEMPLRNA